MQIVVTSRLYTEFPDEQEGRLTKLRSTLTRGETLADFARTIGLGQFIQMGKGEVQSNGQDRDSNLCDAFEALVGAIYMDEDMQLTHSAILLNMLIDSSEIEIEDRLDMENPKGTLQELVQQKYQTKPEYEIIDTDGPDHEKVFTVAVIVNEEILGKGSAGRLRTAEEEAAKEALKGFNPEYLADE